MFDVCWVCLWQHGCSYLVVVCCVFFQAVFVVCCMFSVLGDWMVVVMSVLCDVC